METPYRRDVSSVDDDDTAEAFNTISLQLEQWTSPRVPKWTDVSAMRMMEDPEEDYEDDGLVVANKGNDNDKDKTASYERKVMDWWNRELVAPADRDDDDDNNNNKDKYMDDIGSSTSKMRVTRVNNSTNRSSDSLTPKRPTVERAATPIMSNSSKKKLPNKFIASSSSVSGSATSSLVQGRNFKDDSVDESLFEEQDTDTAEQYLNVQSPWVQQQQQHLYSSSRMTPRALASFRNQQYEYGRYHDALLVFFKARQSLSDRLDMEREEQGLDSLMADTNDTLAFELPPAEGHPKLLQEESLAELAFLRTLKDLSWERDTFSSPTTESHPRDWLSRREGNFWALLYHLRTLGLNAMLWADDDVSLRQHAKDSAGFLAAEAAKLDSSSKELLQGLEGNFAPLVLQRQKHILNWLEHCMNQLITAETKASLSMAARNTAATEEDIHGADDNFRERSPQNMEKVWRSCLSLILAGRLEDARMLLRNAGEFLSAAKLGGGAPAGFEKVDDDHLQEAVLVRVGNVNRALWKRQMWRLSGKMNKPGSGGLPEEAAIHSLLANDLQMSLENAALRTWEKSLYAIFHAMWGRTQDEQLHMHNRNRRRCRPPYPGTSYEDCEVEQLQGTCLLSNMTERGVVEMLSASPFQSMRGHESFCDAISALLVGRTALINFLLQETDILTNPDAMAEEPEDRISRLRFTTHVLLYLDSFKACATPVLIPGIDEAKNQALLAYVDFLATHEELWHLLVLYATLLPEELIMEYLPSVLVRVEGEEYRKTVVEQARELLPGNGMDRALLKIVVRRILAEEDDLMAIEGDEDGDGAINVPTRSDMRKMKAIQWLCFYEDHAGEALIAANILLRQLLLDNKLPSAVLFLQDFLPEAVVERAMTTTKGPNDEDKVEAILGMARNEHIAYQSYLKAFRAVEEWRLVISSTPSSSTPVDDKVDASVLNETEQSIAKSMEKREIIGQKRKTSLVIVEAAETARKDIMRVLLHEGGWLADLEADTGIYDTSPEGLERKNEMQALRSRMLPYAVKFMHEVCEATAAWMWNSLLDGSPTLGSTPKEVLEAIGETGMSSTEDGTALPLSCFSPRFWTQQALELAETVSSDQYNVHQAFGAWELKELLAKLSDIALSDLMYSA
jgi:Nuclear pore protein 84 / 107